MQRCLQENAKRIRQFVFCPGHGALLSLIVFSALIGALIVRLVIRIANRA